MKKHRDRLFQTRSLEGTVEYGVDADSETHRELRKLSSRLDSDFADLTHGETPSMLWSVLQAILGIVVAVGSLALIVWGGSDGDGAAAPAQPPPPKAKPGTEGAGGVEART